MKSRIVILSLLLAFSSVLVSCNTMRGVGQDVEAAGSAVERKAEEKKTY